MSITNSTILEDRVQLDGRRHVRERHTDHLGTQHHVAYMAESGANATTTMTARVAQLESALASSELDENEARATADSGFIAPTFQHCTAGQMRARIRELFRTGRSWRVCRIAWYIQQLGLTDAQLKAMFGVNDAQLVTLKAKLASLETKYNDVQTQQGE